jgi:hypothetical protein
MCCKISGDGTTKPHWAGMLSEKVLKDNGFSDYSEEMFSISVSVERDKKHSRRMKCQDYGRNRRKRIRKARKPGLSQLVAGCIL